MAQKQFIIDGGFTTNADSTLVGNLDMTGHIIPSVDSDGVTGYDLGSPTMKWRDLYLSQGSLYIDGQKVIESNSGTIVVQADPGQSLTTKVSGAGVMTLESETTVNMASTLQMSSGKKITDQGGNAVVFGDKVDMDNNQLINVGAPTADGHATTKGYVDALIGNIATDAITEGDTEIEIADLGTGTVGITVDGSQRLALSATAAAFTVPVTVNGTALASVSEVAAAEDAANVYTNQQLSNLINSAPGALDTLNELASALGDDANFSSTVVNNIATAKSEAIASAEAKDVARATASAADATAKANQALVDAKAYADTAEADAIASAEAKDVARATASAADATAKADQALVDAKTYADTAEADAISTAAADATSKANAAQAAALSALTHFHSAVQDVTSAQSTTNTSNTVNFTFSELSGAKTYGVYLNRQLLRPDEYSVSGTTVTISVGVLASSDELEVTGLKV